MGIKVHEKGTIVVIQGPRFSTRAESKFFRSQGWDIINMTQYPEVILARELEMCYVNISLITDYDVGVEGDPDVEPVSNDEVMRVFNANLEKLRSVHAKGHRAHPLQALLPLRQRDEACEDHRMKAVTVPQGVEKKLKAAIRKIPDFPTKGIMFRDVTTLWKDGALLKECNEVLYKRYKKSRIDAVLGIEARGFIVGAPLAVSLGVGFLPFRKVGKLPGTKISESYDLEYGTATLRDTHGRHQKGAEDTHRGRPHRDRRDRPRRSEAGGGPEREGGGVRLRRRAVGAARAGRPEGVRHLLRGRVRHRRRVIGSGSVNSSARA